MKYAFLCLYIAASAAHLWHSAKNDARRRAYTKPFLLVFLTLYYIFSGAELNVFLLSALITSWLGDVLLIPKGNIWFAMGGISFTLSHFAFIAAFARDMDFTRVPWIFIALAAIPYLLVSLRTIIAVLPSTPKKLVPPMYLYLITNATMNLFALMQLLTRGGLGAALAYVGAVLFFGSDCVLFLVRYHKNKELVPGKHFPVMLGYLSGELMITLGMVIMDIGTI